MGPLFNAIKVGDAPAPLVCGPLTRTQFVRYAGASHDFNPNHHDEVYAQANGNKAGRQNRSAVANRSTPSRATSNSFCNSEGAAKKEGR